MKAKKLDTKVYVEVSNIGPSEEERKTSYIFHELAKPYVFDSEVAVAGKIYKTLSHPRIAEIKREINNCVRKAKTGKECFVVRKPGMHACMNWPIDTNNLPQIIIIFLSRRTYWRARAQVL